MAQLTDEPINFIWNLISTDLNSIISGRNKRDIAAKAKRAATETSIVNDTIKSMFNGFTNSANFAFDKVRDDIAKNTNSIYIMDNVGDAYIDVVNKFSWTTSPDRTDAPSIELIEKQITVGSELNRAIRTFTSAIESGGQLFKMGGNLLASATDSVNKTLSLLGIDKNYTEFISTFQTKLSSFSDNITQHSSTLAPYDDLYKCVPTKWVYKLPYFSDTTLNIIPNRYTTTSNTAIKHAETLANTVNDFLGGIEGTANQLLNNSQFSTEMPKSYEFGNEGATFELKFPLLNTTSYADVVKNWQFLFLLMYQNRPYRLTRNMISPTCIYEVNIPGIRYIPYAFIQNIEISMKGTRCSNIDIPIKVDNRIQKISSIIPEAYDVKLTLQSLTNESQNFMVALAGNTKIQTSGELL